jgi:hypothetical protein
MCSKNILIVMNHGLASYRLIRGIYEGPLSSEERDGC